MAQNILITGTNSGFGRLAAHTLAGRGHHVFATMRDIAGRNREAAEALERAGDEAPGTIRVVEMELTSDDAVNGAVAKVVEQVGHLDGVVSNAGYAAIGLEETQTSEQVLRQLDVNTVGVHRLLRAVLPGMRERGQGLFLQVSSTLARLVLPYMGVYCASKAALEALLDAYRYELAHSGIDIAIVQPGLYPTDFSARLARGEDASRARGYGAVADGLAHFETGRDAMIRGDGAPDPQDVADAIAGLVEQAPGTRPDRVVVDAVAPEGAEELNRVHAAAQKGMLAAMGMGSFNGSDSGE